MIVTLTLALAAGLVPPQSTWHVDVNATPPGDGSPGSPYTSIQYAIAQPGTQDDDTLLVAAGTYVETVDFLEKRVHVVGVEGPLRTTLLPPYPAAPWVVRIGTLEAATRASIEGFTIARGGPYGPGQTGVEVLSGSVPDTVGGDVRRCILTGHWRGLEVGYTTVVDRCTVTGNRIGVNGSCNAGLSMTNSVVRGNDFGDVVAGGVFCPPVYVDHSNVTSPPGSIVVGTGNVADDPRFWDAAGGDYRLRPGSPCIDAGDPQAPPDPDGSRVDMGALPYDPFHAPGTATSCFGSAALCPCGNGGSGAGGCDVAQGTGGVAIGVRDFAPDDAGGGTATIFGTDYPPAGQPGVTLIRSPGAQDPPVVFGDGLRCIAATGLVRVRATLAVGGYAELPVMHGAGAGTFRYQIWNRNTPVVFCDPTAAFNLSNALEVTWP